MVTVGRLTALSRRVALVCRLRPRISFSLLFIILKNGPFGFKIKTPLGSPFIFWWAMQAIVKNFSVVKDYDSSFWRTKAYFFIFHFLLIDSIILLKIKNCCVCEKWHQLMIQIISRMLTLKWQCSIMLIDDLNRWMSIWVAHVSSRNNEHLGASWAKWQPAGVLCILGIASTMFQILARAYYKNSIF